MRRTRVPSHGFWIAAPFVALYLVACTSQLDSTPKAEILAKAEVQEAEAETGEGAPAGVGPRLDRAASRIGFLGAKVTADHAGTFETYTATAKLDGETLSALSVEVETASVAIEPAKLRKHMMSDHFFLVEEFPIASFESTEIAAKAGADGATHEITGNLNLRGVEKTVRFPAIIEVTGDRIHGKAVFKIVREDFGISYPGMKDDLIKPEVALDIELTFSRS